MLQALIALAAIGAEPSSAVPVQEEPLHRVVFVSKEFRVLDVVLPPHVTTLYHVHSNDMAGVTLVPGPMRDESPGNPPQDDPADPSDDVWFVPHAHDVHRVTNLGDSPIRMIGIELLTPRKLTSAGANRDKAPDVILENDRVRVIRISLGRGKKSEIHSHGPYVLVSLGRGSLANVCGKAKHQVIETAGFLCAGVDRQHQIVNVGDGPIELLEFELAE